MPFTRAQGETALNYVVLTSMNQPVDGPVVKALADAQIDHVDDLTSLIEPDIDNLAYTAADGNRSSLGPGHRGVLRAFCAYVRYRAVQTSPIGDDWTSITAEEFNAFRVSPMFNGTIYGNTSISNPGLPAAPSTRARDPVADFKRGIKRDPSQIPILKDEKQLDNWQRTTIAQTRAQDDPEALNLTHPPTTIEDKALSKEKQTYIAEVLDPTYTPISTFVKSRSTNVDSFSDERIALIHDSTPAVGTIDDCIMHRNGGLYDVLARKAKTKEIDYASTPTVDTSKPTVDTIDDFIAHRNGGIYDVLARKAKTKETDYATMPTVDTISIIDACITHRNGGLYDAHARGVRTKETDDETIRLFFGWLHVDTIIKRTFAATTLVDTSIKRTFAATTQFDSIPMSTTLKPADTVYSDTRDIESGTAQLFAGTATLLHKNPPAISKEHSDYDRSWTKTSFSRFQQVWNPTNRHFLTFKILCVDSLGGETSTPLDYNDGETTKEYHHISSCNNLDRGEITSEHLAVIAANDPVTYTIHVKDNDVLEPDGWKLFKYQYGYEIPKDYQHSRLDERAGKTKWQDSTKIETTRLNDYDTFKNYGHSGRPPNEYKEIREHDGCHKSRLVADGDHPEIDTSESLDKKGIQYYQSLIGTMQWAVSIGRTDITTTVMTLSGFRSARYLAKIKHADIDIHVRTEEPDYSGLLEQELDWTPSVNGNVQEVKLTVPPEALGKHVTLPHYIDANAFHDIITGRSAVNGMLHLINKTPIDRYSKKQATAQMATHGSKSLAAHTSVERDMDQPLKLRYLGVPSSRNYIFGDDKTVVKSSIRPRAKLHKSNTAQSFYRVREAIAAKTIGFYHIDGVQNPADILSKHWGYQQVWKLLRPLLFWPGDTVEILDLEDVKITD
jgi:hypothetical protein